MKLAMAIAAVGILSTVFLATFDNAQNYSEDKWEALFLDFVNEHQKSYDNLGTFQARFENFKANSLKIDAHNKDKEQSYTMGMNAFGDLTTEEFSVRFGVVVPKKRTLRVVTEDLSDVKIESIDWMKKGKVTAVKDQGSCGSCWAFSAVGAIEAAYALQHDVLADMSEQQLVDCSHEGGNAGCQGGWMDSAFEHAEKHGMCVQNDYVYHAKNEACHETTCEDSHHYTVHDFVDLPKDAAVYDAKIQETPIAVAVDATGWQFYSGGVFESTSTNLNHGVLLYGLDVSQKAWLVKNSWGSRWGVKGTILLAAGNTSGILEAGSYVHTD